MLSAPEQMDVFQARALTAMTDLHTALADHHRRISESWSDLPRWRRLASGLMSTVGLVIVARLSGNAAHGLEQLAMFEATPLADAAHSLPAHSSADYQHPYGLAMYSAPATIEPAIHPLPEDDGPVLPADLDAAPTPAPIGDYDPGTGHGTDWYQTVEYADKLGYGNLTEHQKWVATDYVLRYDHLTWDDARHLPPGYAPALPSQRTMLQVLQDADAHQTHAADRPAAVVPVVPHDEHPPASPPAAPPATLPGVDSCHDSWFPFFDCRFDSRDVVMGTVLLGTLALGAAGQYAIDRRRARDAQTIIVEEDNLPAPDDPSQPGTDRILVPPHRIPSSATSRRARPEQESSAGGDASRLAFLALSAAALAKLWRDRRILRRKRHS